MDAHRRNLSVIATTAELAARYRGYADELIEKAQTSVPQLKHDGVVWDTKYHVDVAEAGKKIVVVLDGGGNDEFVQRRTAFTNLCVMGAADYDAILFIGSERIEVRELHPKLTGDRLPFDLLSGEGCVPARAYQQIRAEFEFHVTQPTSVTICFDLVTEAVADENTLRERIFLQEQSIVGEKADRDGTTPFYTLPLAFNHPVADIEALLPAATEAAWLLLDYEHHGLHLRWERAIDDVAGLWKIAFDHPFNFSQIASAKLVYRCRETRGAREVAVTAHSLNILRARHGLAGVAFAS